MMDVPPIEEGPRTTREKAVNLLVCQGFERQEAVEYLDASDLRERRSICEKVTKRKRDRGIPA